MATFLFNFFYTHTQTPVKPPCLKFFLPISTNKYIERTSFVQSSHVFYILSPSLPCFLLLYTRDTKRKSQYLRMARNNYQEINLHLTYPVLHVLAFSCCQKHSFLTEAHNNQTTSHHFLYSSNKQYFKDTEEIHL